MAKVEHVFGYVTGSYSYCCHCQSHIPVDDEEVAARHRRRQQKATLRKQREKELCRLHLAREIQRQMEEVEQRQRDVEQRGIVIEKLLRGETQGCKRCNIVEFLSSSI